MTTDRALKLALALLHQERQEREASGHTKGTGYLEVMRAIDELEALREHMQTLMPLSWYEDPSFVKEKR